MSEAAATALSLPAGRAARPRDWRRVYIFPTRQGFAFGALVIVILLGAINYDNALAYLLCFLLAGLFLVAMLHTYHNLAGLALTAAQVDAVFAGDPARCNLQFGAADARPRFAVTFARRGARSAWWRRAPVSTAATVECFDPATPVTLHVPTTRRGVLPLGRLQIESTFPLGVLRAWAYFDPDTEVVVYPRPAGSLPLPLAAAVHGAHGAGIRHGVEDFVGFKPYRAGDSLRAVHWRSLARQDEPLVKQFRGGGAADAVLRWSAFDSRYAPEARLSQLAQWILEAERHGCRYSLELPGWQLPAGRGRAHRTQCLQALARHVHA